MSESNHIFTFDNRVISYSVYEQALKEIDSLEDKVYHSTRRVEQLEQEIAALKEENDKLTKLFSIQLDVMKTNEELIEENQKLKAALNEARDTLNETIKDREGWHLFPVIVPAIVRFNALLGKE